MDVVRIRFLRETKWCVGTEAGPTAEVFAEGDVAELPEYVAAVFVGVGAAVPVDGEDAVAPAGEKATRRRK